MTAPTYPLETVVRVPAGFWNFVQQLPLDARDKLLRYGSVRYQMRRPPQKARSLDGRLT